MRYKVWLLVLVGAPFLVLGPSNITVSKIVYGFFILSFAFYVLFNEHWASSKFRSTFVSAILLACLVLVGILVGIARNNSFESLSSVYNLLIPALWLITIPYASSKVSKEFLLRVFFLLGFLASIITFYKWTNLRGYLNSSFDIKALDSDWNIYLILIIFLILSNQFGKMEKSLYFCVLIFSMLLTVMSGTRTLFFIYGYIFALCLFFARTRVYPIATLSISFIVGFYLSLPALPEALKRRYLDFFTNVDSISLFQYINGFDESTKLRSQQRGYFKNLWLENTYFGTGIGQTSAEAVVVADTPYAFLAQFGVFGAFCLMLVLIYLFTSTFSIVKKSNINHAKLLVIYFLCLFPITFAYNWTLHKSFWLSLSCLIGYVFNNVSYTQSRKKTRLLSRESHES